MSVTITQRPEYHSCYAKNTVPDFIMTTDETIMATLTMQSHTFTAQYVPDFDGRVKIDFSQLYGDYIKTLMPNSDVYSQASSMISCEASFAGSNTGPISYPIGSPFQWYVFNAKLNSSTAFQTWVRQNFMTNQPLEKPTTFDSPEYLTFLDLDTPAGRKVKVIFYPNSGGNEIRQLTTTNVGGCYTVNVSYSLIIRLANHLSSYYKGYYDVILTDSSDNELARQRYIYKERSGREHYFLFVNALGGVDTLICDGENVLQPDTTHNIGRFDRQYKPLDDTDDTRQWSQDTGMMPWRWRNWIHELFSSKQDAIVYNQENETQNHIVITDSSVSMGDNGQLASASFTYMLTDVDNVVADNERALDRSLHQSVADEAEELADLSEGQVAEFAPVQGGEGYATEEITISATKIYVVYPKTAQTHLIEYAVGGKRGYTFDTADDGPFVISKSAAYSLQFFCDDNLVPTLELRYYPTSIS